MPFVYILRCADNTFYIGHTQDLASREALHNSGAGADHTALRRLLTTVDYQSSVGIGTEAITLSTPTGPWESTIGLLH
jgi:putative endonuclease